VRARGEIPCGLSAMILRLVSCLLVGYPTVHERDRQGFEEIKNVLAFTDFGFWKVAKIAYRVDGEPFVLSGSAAPKIPRRPVDEPRTQSEARPRANRASSCVCILCFQRAISIVRLSQGESSDGVALIGDGSLKA